MFLKAENNAEIAFILICQDIVWFKGHMQRKISKPQNFEKMKISIYKIDMQNVKSHRVL